MDNSVNRPFTATHHRRTDKLAAMLLGIANGEAIYRVQWFERGKRQENTLVRSEKTFSNLFERVTA
jgi:hypothetical protein